jgi:hypothetical protein
LIVGRRTIGRGFRAFPPLFEHKEITMRPLLLLLAGATALASCAPSTEIAGSPTQNANARVNRCFNLNDVQNFAVDSRDDLYVRSGRDKVFQINTLGGCWDLDSAITLAITPRFFPSSSACVGDSVQVIVPMASPGNRRCRALVVKALTPEEVAALPKRSQP